MRMPYKMGTYVRIYTMSYSVLACTYVHTDTCKTSSELLLTTHYYSLLLFTHSTIYVKRVSIQVHLYMRSIGWLLCAIVDHNGLSLIRRSLSVFGLWGSPIHRTPHAVITLTIHYDQHVYMLHIILYSITYVRLLTMHKQYIRMWQYKYCITCNIDLSKYIQLSIIKNKRLQYILACRPLSTE